MYLHPSLLVFLPIFLIEGFLLPYFPILGVTPAITVLALALTFQFMNNYRIVLVCAFLGIVGEFAFANDKLGFLLGYLALAAVLILAKKILRQPPYSGKAQLGVALVGLFVVEASVLAVSPNIDLKLFADYMLAAVIVQVLMFFAVNGVETVVRRVA